MLLGQFRAAFDIGEKKSDCTGGERYIASSWMIYYDTATSFWKPGFAETFFVLEQVSRKWLLGNVVVAFDAFEPNLIPLLLETQNLQQSIVFRKDHTVLLF